MNTLLRMLRHRWYDESDVHRLLDSAAMDRLEARVARSERGHSGEIRVCVEAGLPLSYLWRKASAHDRALTLFGKQRVWDTEHNNGVLIYLLLAEHRIELIADRALARRVPPAQWQALVDRMQAAFRQGQLEAGLMDAIDEVDQLLVKHFPEQAPGVATAQAPTRGEGAGSAEGLPNRPWVG